MVHPSFILDLIRIVNYQYNTGGDAGNITNVFYVKAFDTIQLLSAVIIYHIKHVLFQYNVRKVFDEMVTRAIKTESDIGIVRWKEIISNTSVIKAGTLINMILEFYYDREQNYMLKCSESE